MAKKKKEDEAQATQQGGEGAGQETAASKANAVDDSEGVEAKRHRIRAIRRLARTFPDHSISERLQKIVGLATGELDPKEARPVDREGMARRLAAGKKSRATRTALDLMTEEEREKRERKAARERQRLERESRDRGEPSGQDR